MKTMFALTVCDKRSLLTKPDCRNIAFHTGTKQPPTEFIMSVYVNAAAFQKTRLLNEISRVRISYRYSTKKKKRIKEIRTYGTVHYVDSSFPLFVPSPLPGNNF